MFFCPRGRGAASSSVVGFRSILSSLRQHYRRAASYGAARLENFERLARAQGSEARRLGQSLLKRAVFVWHGGEDSNPASLLAAAEYKESAADDFIRARLGASSSLGGFHNCSLLVFWSAVSRSASVASSCWL